jgi:hypothetical protein
MGARCYGRNGAPDGRTAASGVSAKARALCFGGSTPDAVELVMLECECEALRFDRAVVTDGERAFARGRIL